MLQQWDHSLFFPAGNWVQCNLVVGVVSRVGLPPARSGPGGVRPGPVRPGLSLMSVGCSRQYCRKLARYIKSSNYFAARITNSGIALPCDVLHFIAYLQVLVVFAFP